jgi:hypothetical protein
MPEELILKDKGGGSPDLETGFIMVAGEVQVTLALLQDSERLNRQMKRKTDECEGRRDAGQGETLQRMK